MRIPLKDLTNTLQQPNFDVKKLRFNFSSAILKVEITSVE